MEEFEITYLPRKLPDGVFSAPKKDMVDIYVPASAEHPHLRIRKCGDEYEITNKQPIADGDASHQMEQTIVLTKEEFTALEKADGKRVAKTRYYYTEEGVHYEIDVFKEDLNGLVLVDVEFQSREEKDVFKAPDWILADITQEQFIAGGMLAGKEYADIAEQLESFGYQKV